MAGRATAPLSRWHHDLDRWELAGSHGGSTSLHKAGLVVGWAQDRAGSLHWLCYPDPSCAPASSQTPSRAELRQLHPAHTGCTPCLATGAKLGHLQCPVPDRLCQQPHHHLCPGAQNPAGCQHPWGQHPAQSGVPGAKGTTMGEAVWGALQSTW